MSIEQMNNIKVKVGKNRIILNEKYDIWPNIVTVENIIDNVKYLVATEDAPYVCGLPYIVGKVENVIENVLRDLQNKYDVANELPYYAVSDLKVLNENEIAFYDKYRKKVVRITNEAVRKEIISAINSNDEIDKIVNRFDSIFQQYTLKVGIDVYSKPRHLMYIMQFVK